MNRHATKVLLEELDAKKLKEDIKKIKLQTFDTMFSILRMEEANLKLTGHKTKEAALLYLMNRANKIINELQIKFFKDHPD